MHKYMDRKILLNLLNEEGYPNHMIDSTITKLELLNPVIKDSFDSWIAKGTTPDIEIEGYSFQMLVDSYGMKPVGAFLTLNWLTKDPETALRSLKRGIR